MSIYYYGELVGTYNQKQTEIEGQEPTLVGDIIKNNPNYRSYSNQQKTKFVVRHFQEA